MSARAFALAVFLSFHSLYAFADIVQSVESDGTVILDNGRSVRLAGVLLEPEAVPLLRAMIAGKKVDFKLEGGGEEGASVPSGYLFFTSQEIDFPFKDAQPREKRTMVNELLLSLGAARAQAGTSFKNKEAFLALEDEARKNGHGIWSYETSSP